MSDENSSELYSILQTLLTMTPQEQTKWFDENASKLDPDDLLALAWQSEVASGANASTGLSKVLGSNWRNNGRPELADHIFDDVAIDVDQEAEKRVNAAAQGQTINQDLDGDGKVEEIERRAISDAADRAAQQNADQRGVDKEQARGELDRVIDTASSFTNWPSYLINALGGQAPDEAMIRDLIAKWNELNPDQPITPGDVTTLSQRLSQQSNPMTKHVVESVLTGEDPVMDYRVTMLDGTSHIIQAESFAAAQKAFQGDFSAKELTYFVRLSSQFGLSDANGDPAWQVMAALARAAGYRDVSETQYANNGRQAAPTTSVAQQNNERAKLAALQRKTIAFNAAMREWGNTYIALLVAMDPALGMRLANTKHSEWSVQDVNRANQLFVNSGVIDESSIFGEMGYSADRQILADISTDANELTADKSSSGGGTIRTMPDPVAIRQSARDMYKQMFLSDPTDGQLDSFVASIQGQMTGAADNQSVDGAARLRAIMEQNPQYNELYGKMRPGQTEMEYQNQFRAGAQSLLGNEAVDPNAIRSGMRTGQYQTTLGAVASNKQSWQNSTFLGRLAVAGQVVAANT